MNHAAPCPTFRIEYAQLTDLGMRRLNNQDAVAVVVTDDEAMWKKRGHLLMVADGMGAHAAGELASKLAVDNIPQSYFKLRDLYPPAALRQAIRDANAVVLAKGQSEIGFQGMGTTCSCLVLLPQGALVAHIGDSRIYRLRGHQFVQLTFDHSLVWEMAAAGHMAEEDVPAYIPKNVITRSLGPHETVNIDLEGPFDAAAGDVFLLCSDGLSGQVSDEELGALLQCLTPEDAVQTLVDLANLRGGPDNISVVVVRVNDAATTAPSESADKVVPSVTPKRDGALLRAASIACFFALSFCLITQRWIAAMVLATGLATAVGLLIAGRNGRRAAGAPTTSLGGPYGNGPYRETRCEPSQQVVDSLKQIADQLRELPDGKEMSIDWTPMDELGGEAKAAAEAGDQETAIKRYAQAIREIMQQIRDQDGTISERTRDQPS